jgi:Ubiquitin-2 like Rad60 SUMO-like
LKLATKSYISLSESDSEDVKPLPARTQPIILDDDDIYSIPQQPKPKPKPKPVEIDPELSDEEFPELVQQARERERLKALAREKASKSFEEQNHTSNELDDDIFQTDSSMANADLIIEVLVTSQIDGTKPLLVKRKLSQRLKEVRLAWCDHQANEGQPMGSEIKDSIFLTWRGKRLYDVTTCKSLNLNIDSSGKISSQGEGVDTNGRVHLEAWTEDIFKSYQKKQAAKLQKEQNGVDEEEVVEEEAVVQKIRLFLRSRELGEFKLQVKPTTPIEKLIAAFRQNKKISDNQEISLHVDGEKLDPAWKIEDTELEDKDVVEVHIK